MPHNRVTLLKQPHFAVRLFAAGIKRHHCRSSSVDANCCRQRYPASATDIGADNGVGMVMNNNYLYASFLNLRHDRDFRGAIGMRTAISQRHLAQAV